MTPALPRTDRPRTAVLRALRGRCPACGGSKVFPGGSSPSASSLGGSTPGGGLAARFAAAFGHAPACTACGWAFDRGPGHWVGGNEVNLLLTYPLCAAAFAVPAVATGPSFWTAAAGGAAALAIGFLAHRPSRCLFFAIDYLFDPDDAPPARPDDPPGDDRGGRDDRGDGGGDGGDGGRGRGDDGGRAHDRDRGHDRAGNGDAGPSPGSPRPPVGDTIELPVPAPAPRRDPEPVRIPAPAPSPAPAASRRR